MKVIKERIKKNNQLRGGLKRLKEDINDSDEDDEYEYNLEFQTTCSGYITIRANEEIPDIDALVKENLSIDESDGDVHFELLDIDGVVDSDIEVYVEPDFYVDFY